MHDARRVSTLLAHRYALHLRNVFDTQVCSMYLYRKFFTLMLKTTHPANKMKFLVDLNSAR